MEKSERGVSMKLLVANHKMNLTKEEITAYLDKMRNHLPGKAEVVFCPSFPYLDLFKREGYQIGSQNVGLIEKGSLTGEVSASQLRSVGVTYGIVGHSERRQKLNETDEMIRTKIELLEKESITPILCIGETLEEHLNGKTNEVLERQLSEDLKNHSEETLSKVVIAYEPIWAIGTGKIPSNEEIYRTVEFIRSVLQKHFHQTTKILYGGSINQENIITLETIENLDGYLVGGASLHPETWISLIDHLR